MDHELIRFRRAAERENRGRRAIRRRYSLTLQQHAVDYCHVRRQQGDGLRTIATALGIAPWSLHRWTGRLKPRPPFRPIELRDAAASAPAMVLTLTAAGPRVDGLTVETAARLLMLLR